MPDVRLVGLALAGTITLCGCAPSPTSSPPPLDRHLSHLSWMVGHWARQPGADPTSATIEDFWTEPAAGAMFGINRVMAGGRTVFYEYLRIEHTPEGTVYFASPKGRHPATGFTLVESAEGRAVFENRAHDFPQRIEYWREGPDRLRARAEGMQDGKMRQEEWGWRRRP